MGNKEHGHSHGTHDHHGSVKNLKVAFLLNAVFVSVEIAGGIITNSMAIISDAVHDFGDSVSLGLSWYLEKFSGKKGDHKFTYGYKRLSIIGALLNALVLLFGTAFVIYKAIPRLIRPEQVHPAGMMALAVIGIIINGLAVLRVKRGKKLVERVVFLHLLEDVMGWAAVLIVSIVMIFIDLPILDPILSLIISVYVIKNVIGGLRKIVKMLLQGVPDGFSVGETKKYILSNNPDVLEVHDVKAWSLDGVENVLTFHMSVKDDLTIAQVTELKRIIKAQLKKRDMKHITIEVENLNNCSDRIE